VRLLATGSCLAGRSLHHAACWKCLAGGQGGMRLVVFSSLLWADSWFTGQTLSTSEHHPLVHGWVAGWLYVWTGMYIVDGAALCVYCLFPPLPLPLFSKRAGICGDLCKVRAARTLCLAVVWGCRGAQCSAHSDRPFLVGSFLLLPCVCCVFIPLPWMYIDCVWSARVCARRRHVRAACLLHIWHQTLRQAD
jgi:hypothetical protein